VATKRSKFDSEFPPSPNDLYRTFDPRAGAALHPHLKPGTRFMEPCVGYGDLVQQLKALGHESVWESDLISRPEYPAAQIDVFNITEDHPEWLPGYVDAIITNPPWTRKILHPMIDHLRQLAPTWLLFEADWAHTRQSIPFMPYCTDIVSVGRMKWIKDSPSGSLKDVAWYRFTRDTALAPTRFHPRITPTRPPSNGG
jgi:hypothetical protein